MGARHAAAISVAITGVTPVAARRTRSAAVALSAPTLAFRLTGSSRLPAGINLAGSFIANCS